VAAAHLHELRLRVADRLRRLLEPAQLRVELALQRLVLALALRHWRRALLSGWMRRRRRPMLGWA